LRRRSSRPTPVSPWAKGPRLTRPAAQLGRLGKFGLDLPNQPAVLGQAEQKIHAVAFAPRHQIIAREAGIVGLQPTGLTRGAQQDAHRRPALPDLGDDARQLLDAAVGLQPTGLTRGTTIDVGRAQFGRQQMPAAKDVKRQIAVVVVIAVGKAALLMPVQRVVGRVEVEDDLRRRRTMRVEKEIDKQPLDHRRVIVALTPQALDRAAAARHHQRGARGRGPAGIGSGARAGNELKRTTSSAEARRRERVPRTIRGDGVPLPPMALVPLL
jgi:hypothetical protein